MSQETLPQDTRSKKVRKVLSLTQEDLASLLGVSQSAISRLEQDQVSLPSKVSNIRLRTLYDIAAQYKGVYRLLCLEAYELVKARDPSLYQH
jgi:transcriptional regulator with XRE-family HTH domain